MTSIPSRGGNTKFTPSGKHDACPICRRVKDGDCRISSGLVLCHRNTDHKVGDVIKGWVFAGVSDDGRTGKFTPHKPLKKQLEIIYGYSDTQRSKRYSKNGKKCFAVQNLVGGRWAPGAGLNRWPVFFENEALAGLDSLDSDGVVWEFEGEKCCELAVQGGLLAVSQPGHAHSSGQRVPRYQRLKEGGCTLLIYVADYDKEGEKKAAEAVEGAQGAGLKIKVIRARQVWPDTPSGGSIDDAPGTVKDRAAALRAFVELQAPEPEPTPDHETDHVTPMQSAAESLGLSQKIAGERDRFTFSQLLPPKMAAAVELIQEDLPTDPLSACLLFLVGLSGLLKIGTRASSSYRHSVPINLYLALVAWSGVAKSPCKRKLVEAPAELVKKDFMAAYERKLRAWREECKTVKRKEDRPPEPKCVLPHLNSYNAASLSAQLMVHDKERQPILLIRDELSGLLREIEHDTKGGTGAAEAQFLEAFDGDGYVSVRVEAGVRQYKHCHVCFFGCIQPQVLQDFINGESHGDDTTGRWARLLLCRLPAQPLKTEDQDPSPERLSAYQQAEHYLKQCCWDAHCLPPKTYELSQEARIYFHEWFNKHQRVALMPTTAPVIRSMLMKTSAHALRLAGALHVAKTLELRDAAPERISCRQVELATQIVDQLHAETAQFHDQQETDSMLLMRHIHEQGFRADGCTWQWAKQQGTRAIRAMGSKMFAQAVQELVTLGYGVVKVEKPLTYRALKEMTK